MLKSDAPQVAVWRSWRSSIAAASPAERDRLLSDRARDIRRNVVRTIAEAGQGHIGGDLSVTDIRTTLYDAVLTVDPERPCDPHLDRFVMSKGHCAASLYSTLAQAGFFPESELATFMKPMSALNGHPNRNKVPGVETNTGPLGHGMPVAVGQAIAATLSGIPSRVYVVLGDGEMQEGSNWEALMLAGHRRLTNLWVIVDRNRLQQGDRTEETNGLDPLPERLAAFGFDVREIDGHDYTQLYDAFSTPGTGRPVAVVANTIKGKGVSFIEDRVEWHHKVPNADQVRQALLELEDAS